jgi:hypothetical protein
MPAKTEPKQKLSDPSLDQESSDRRKEQKEKVLESLRNGVKSISRICEAVGISRQTYYNWLSEDPEFRRDTRDSKCGAIEAVTDVGFVICTVDRHPGFVKWWLCNRDPENWSMHPGSVDVNPDQVQEMAEEQTKILNLISLGAERPDAPATP